MVTAFLEHVLLILMYNSHSQLYGRGRMDTRSFGQLLEEVIKTNSVYFTILTFNIVLSEANFIIKNNCTPFDHSACGME